MNIYGIYIVTDYRHCAETQDHRVEGSKTASTPPYILIADQYCLQITIPISATYYPIMSYYLHLLRVYIEALELHSQSSRSCISTHCKAYTISAYLSASAYPSASPCLCLPVCAALIRSIDRIVYSIRWLVVVVWFW